MKNLMLIVGAFMLFGLVAKAQPSMVNKPTEWKPNTTVLISPNQKYRLVYQADGNLVVYDKSNKPLWNSQTNGKTPNKLVFQADGNLVLYGANNAVHWASYSHNKGGKSLRLNDQGSLTVWDEKNNIWSTTSARLTGYIKKITDKGFLFITSPDGDRDVFAHISKSKNGFESLKEGQEVSYELVIGPKGSEAINVLPL